MELEEIDSKNSKETIQQFNGDSEGRELKIYKYYLKVCELYEMIELP